MDASRTRDESPCPIGFIGDLDDAWVVGIADALAAGRRVHRGELCRSPCPTAPSDRPPFREPSSSIDTRSRASDAERLEQWRAQANDAGSGVDPLHQPVCPLRGAGAMVRPRRSRRLRGGRGRGPAGPPGPSARWVRPATTAARPPGLPDRSGRRRGRIVSALADACVRGRICRQDGGRSGDRRRAELARSGSEATPGERVLTIWEVPVLESGWARRLESRAHRTGPVIALAGFADRVGRDPRPGSRGRRVPGTALRPRRPDRCRRPRRGATPPDSWPIPPRAEAGAPAAAAPSQPPSPSQLGRPVAVAGSRGVAYNTVAWQVTGNEWESMPKARVPTKTGAGESGPRRASGGSRRAPDGPPATTSAPPATLKDLTRQIQRAPGFPEVLAALKNGRSATIDGAWGSASALTAAALGLHAPDDPGDRARPRRRRRRLPRRRGDVRRRGPRGLPGLGEAAARADAPTTRSSAGGCGSLKRLGGSGPAPVGRRAVPGDAPAGAEARRPARDVARRRRRRHGRRSRS